MLLLAVTLARSPVVTPTWERACAAGEQYFSRLLRFVAGAVIGAALGFRSRIRRRMAARFRAQSLTRCVSFHDPQPRGAR